ncbi:hypothetical protein SAY86_031448 [Trapa natans]|uniref:Aluminum-activated malate transporter n=1 Tax=Trapa natans TaxID=22666 RepID=A0AAN7M7L9_TRANT|nr:hypothetical protein SAY86_031448 [Trapa natans]
MESEMEHSKTGVVGLFRLRVKSAMGNATARISTAGRDIVEVGKDDPRRAIHSLKVGLTLTLVSLIYYYQPLYTNFGATAMWAVMTVVVVFEFSVGATLSKGLNRGLATLFAGALGVGAHHLACMSGKIGEPILLGFFVFLQAAATTFMRFFPGIKARYDYGMLIFILTFSLVSVSGYRYDEILTMAHRRLSTIFIGGATCVIVSIVVCPVWAGEDLHNLIALNMEKLGNFLEGFGDEFFGASADTDHAGTTADRSKSLRGYKTVLVSKSTEETMANFARWEPSHGEFRFRHPWKLYLELGALTRECAYRIEALDGYLNANLQVPAAARESIEGVCRDVSSEAAKALKEMAVSVRTMTRHAALADPDLLLGDCHDAVKDLKALLKASQWKETDLLAAVPLFTVTSLLIDVVKCTEKIAERVQELSSLANFREVEPTSLLEKPAPRAGGKNKVPKPAVVPDVECPPPHIVLTVHEMAPENGRAPAPLNTS